MSRAGSGGRWIRALVCSAVALAVVPTFGASTAGADTAPVDPATPATVSADSLPTVQINGVVWDQVVVGSRVYATGRFTSARPAGSPAGSNETARSNILAYDITTGALITSWAPTLNAQGRSLTASPDGTRIYVGGDFTTVNSVRRNRIAALDATTGALISSFDPNANAKVNDIAISGDTAYLGGAFTVVKGQARNRLAAVDMNTGALRPWAPNADREVKAVVAPQGAGKIVAGGHFESLNGDSTIKGMGALDPITGSTMPWPVNQIIVNWGQDAGIWSLTTNGTSVYGTGMTYLVNGINSGNFEGTFSANAATGELEWVTGCRGDHYDVAVVGQVVYDVSHAHDCANSGGLPQTQPWTYQYASAWSAAPAAGGATNGPGYFSGRPRPDLLHWTPTLTAGNFTGMYQAAWTIEGNDQYVVLGGEFPRVNGTNQSGLARFPVRSISPNKSGPQACADSTPTLVGTAPGSLRVSTKAAWDRDNAQLTYEFLRGSSAATAVVVKTVTAKSVWWNRPVLSFTDTGAAPGSSQTYRVRVTDPLGNTCTSSTRTATVPSGTTAASAYRDSVQAESPLAYWRLGEPSGTVGYDLAGADDLTLDPGVQRGVAGALIGDGDSAARFVGSGTVPASTTSMTQGSQDFTVELWFNTTSTNGGKLVGFGNSSSANSSNYDRHVYLSDDGTVRFGVFDGSTRVVSSSPGLNDGQWHHVVASMGPGGQRLHVDGSLVAVDPSATVAQAYSGYWRLGGDNLSGWPGQPSSFAYTGALDEVAVYSGQLSLDRIRAHHLASGRSASWPQAPADAYGAAVWQGQPNLFLRLDETSGSAARDTTTNATGAEYAGGVALGGSPSPAAPGGTSISLDSGSARVVGTRLVNDPQTFTIETWFRTTTTTGGRIMGFGNSRDESSSGYDRHLYMLDSGQLRYGVWTGAAATIDSGASYNDGEWHHVAVTQQPGTQRMYVDGQLVATGTAPFAQSYSGYWRLGSDNIWGGASSKDFRGQLDEAAVYPSVLDAATLQSHAAFGVAPPPNVAPTASFTSSTDFLGVSVNGSGSSDPDGSIVSYAWNFGDGATGTGANANHTYAAAGTYTVTLTVTDDDGAVNSTTAQVTVNAPPANVAPTASFTSSTDFLGVSVNGSGSSDPDGSIVSYAWNFGDGATGTGANASHTYAAAGTYTVTLTVTDDDGAVNSTTAQVTVNAPPPNVAPTAAFSSQVSNLAVAFNAAASSDSDGSIVNYAWNFGDGTTGTGANASHTYAAAGTYTVTLTVTDDDGATGTATAQVTAVDPGGPQVLIADLFERSTTNGLGTADIGGNWALTGTASNFSVANGTGRISLPTAGAMRFATLTGTTARDTDTTVQLALDKAPTGGGTFVGISSRKVGTTEYILRVRVRPGLTNLEMIRIVNGTATTFASVALPGIDYTAGTTINLRFQVTGNGTSSTLTGKAWFANAPEPATAQLVRTDTTAALQGPGSIGVYGYNSSTVTNAPTQLSIDNLRSTAVG